MDPILNSQYIMIIENVVLLRFWCSGFALQGYDQIMAIPP